MQTDILAGTSHHPSDLNMLRRAIREEWAVDPAKRPAVVERLLKEAGGPSPALAIKASMVLVQMIRQNQADRHHIESLSVPKNPVNVNVGVQVKVVKGDCWEEA